MQAHGSRALAEDKGSYAMEVPALPSIAHLEGVQHHPEVVLVHQAGVQAHHSLHTVGAVG